MSPHPAPPPNVRLPEPDGGSGPGPSRIAFVAISPESVNGLVDPAQKAFVRRHVMRDFHQKHDVKHPRKQQSPQEPRSFKDQTSRFRLAKKESTKRVPLRPLQLKSTAISSTRSEEKAPQQPEQPEQLRDPLSTFRKDPFIVFPIKANTDTHVLFVYYVNELDNKAMAVNPESDFVPVALGDPACFHVTMAITAQIQNLRLFGTHTPQYWYHRGKALEYLSNSLYGVGRGVTEAMICTTGMLAYTDTFHKGLENTSRQHLIGLQKLVKLNGGLEKLELCMMILRLVTWCELQHLIGLKKELSSRNSPPPPSVPPPASSPKSRLVSYPAGLFYNIRTVVGIIQELVDNCITENPPHALSKLVFSMLNRLLTKPLKGIDLDSMDQEVDVDTRSIIQMSIILFSYTAYPAMTIAGAFSRSICMNLKRNLQEFDVSRLPPELHCWILVCGATAVQDADNRAWFITALAALTTEHNIRDYETFVNVLKQIVWAAGTFEAKCEEIWGRIWMASA